MRPDRYLKAVMRDQGQPDPGGLAMCLATEQIVRPNPYSAISTTSGTRLLQGLQVVSDGASSVSAQKSMLGSC